VAILNKCGADDIKYTYKKTHHNKSMAENVDLTSEARKKINIKMTFRHFYIDEASLMILNIYR
jgi:hypothetical protein